MTRLGALINPTKEIMMSSTKPPSPSVAQRVQSGRDLYARRHGLPTATSTPPAAQGVQGGHDLYEARHGALRARTSGLRPALTAVEPELLGLCWEAAPAPAQTATLTKEIS